MTDEEIRRLIEQKSEGPNLDYKAGFAWTKDNRDKKYELIRDLMAMANTKDGGRVIFGVQDGSCNLVGVSVEIYEGVDPTDVVQMLNDNAAPRVKCALFKREIGGKRVVVFDVAEFEDTPVICTNGVASVDGKRAILRQAAVYVRTVAATTEEVSSPDDMRDLISRAVRRKSDELLKAIQELLTGRPVGIGATATAAYEAELKQAEEFLRS